MGVTPSPLPTDAPTAAPAAELPVWARPEAFPEAPRNALWGWIDRKGRAYPCADAAALIEAVAKDRDGAIDLAWSPASRHLVVPEEIPEIAGALLKQRERNVRLDYEDMMRRFGFLTLAVGAFALYQFDNGWTRLPPAGFFEKSWFVLRLMKFSSSLGLGVIAWLVFGFIPFYQAWKRRRELGQWTAGRIATLAPVYRFESWLAVQRAPFAMVLLGIVGVVYFFQWLAPHDIEAAGLVKSAYARGEWWRLFTAPFLHGFLPHILMNGAAMWYLGRRIEVLARWPHVPMVFLFAAWMGGEFSARWVETASVGASGGIMGWLGFLLVFETLHGQLVPRKSRRRLLAGVLLTGLIGVIGYRFIDNAAHAGGLLAGMLYAWIVFPKSNSPLRPRANATDWIAGALASAVLVASAGFAIWRLVLDWLSSR